MSRLIAFILFIVLFFNATCNRNNSFDYDVLEEEKETAEKVEIDKINIEYTKPPFELKNVSARFAENISYGPSPEHVFDIFIPDSKNPTPIVIYIHGGGFLYGDKSDPYINEWDLEWDYPNAIIELLRNNISFASINYRLLNYFGDKEGVLKSLNDSKRCLQFIRAHGDQFNIDKENVVLSGRSAGAGTSLWLAFSDDMCEKNSKDLISRESTRVKGVAVRATQASYNLERYETDIFNDYNFHWIDYFKIDPDIVPRFKSFYGISDINDVFDEEVKSYREKVDMLKLITKDDPEFWVSNPLKPVNAPTTEDMLNHHAFHARALKKWADSIGVKNTTYYEGLKDNSNEGFLEFMIRKLKER